MTFPTDAELQELIKKIADFFDRFLKLFDELKAGFSKVWTGYERIWDDDGNKVEE